MKNNRNDSMKGGLFLFAAVVALLVLPLAVGYYALPHVPPAIVQANASH